jgi:hypothetical protein
MVEKHTPKGVWLKPMYGGSFFVLGSSTKQQAVPTIQLAIQDLIERKKKHVMMSEHRLRRAQQHLDAAAKWLEVETKYKENQNDQNP